MRAERPVYPGREEKKKSLSPKDKGPSSREARPALPARIPKSQAICIIFFAS